MTKYKIWQEVVITDYEYTKWDDRIDKEIGIITWIKKEQVTSIYDYEYQYFINWGWHYENNILIDNSAFVSF